MIMNETTASTTMCLDERNDDDNNNDDRKTTMKNELNERGTLYKNPQSPILIYYQTSWSS